MLYASVVVMFCRPVVPVQLWKKPAGSHSCIKSCSTICLLRGVTLLKKESTPRMNPDLQFGTAQDVQYQMVKYIRL